MLTPASAINLSAVAVIIFLTNFNSLTSRTSGTIISGSIFNPFALLTLIAALMIAVVCISQISGYETANLQPR